MGGRPILILAGCIVAMLGMMLTFFVGLWAGRSVSIPIGSPSVNSGSGDRYAEIASHPFWKVKASQSQVEALVNKIVAEKRGAIVYVDDRFAVEVLPAPNTPVDMFALRSTIEAVGVQEPTKVGKRCIHLDTYLYSSRPSPESVARDILSAIRVREYKN